MGTFEALYTAIVLAFSFLLSVTTPVAVSPFDTSNKRCETIPALRCVELEQHTTRIYTVGEVVSIHTKFSFSHISQLNGWKEGEVTSDTILPKGKMFALSGSI